MAGRRGLIGARPSGRSRARWLVGGGATGRGVHGESISGITESWAAALQLGDGGEEGLVKRREEERWRTTGLSLYIGAEGEGGG
jgi:hypothetical protein